jgi:hypothetical protein
MHWGTGVGQESQDMCETAVSPRVSRAESHGMRDRPHIDHAHKGHMTVHMYSYSVSAPKNCMIGRTRRRLMWLDTVCSARNVFKTHTFLRLTFAIQPAVETGSVVASLA